MNEENVVPFDPSPRSGMARRGAPDKSQTPPAETLEVECPFCAAVLCLEARVVALRPQVRCAGCDATIPLAGSRAIDIGR